MRWKRFRRSISGEGIDEVVMCPDGKELDDGARAPMDWSWTGSMPAEERMTCTREASLPYIDTIKCDEKRESWQGQVTSTQLLTKLPFVALLFHLRASPSACSRPQTCGGRGVEPGPWARRPCKGASDLVRIRNCICSCGKAHGPGFGPAAERRLTRGRESTASRNPYNIDSSE